MHITKCFSTHTKDVRAVAFCDSAVTASRDGKCILHSVEPQTLLNADVSLNSLAVEGNCVYIGAQDATITSVEVPTLNKQLYIGHSANVSCLDVLNGRLASGSWDHSIRLWSSPSESIELTGHTQNVWDVKFLTDELLVSASADKTVKLWDALQGKLLQTFTGHTDAVRAVAPLSNSKFLTASNDGSIRMWEVGKPDSKCIDAHSSFIYSLAINGEFVVSAGEDRLVKVWDHKLNLLESILVPAVSQWSVALNSTELLIGSSDSKARIFANTKEELGDVEAEYLAELASQTFEAAKSVVDDSVINQAGSPGELVFVGGGTKAFYFYNDRWVPAGRVKALDKPEYNGKQYDYVFEVDVADGAPPVKLPYNASDNPYNVAERFVLEHDLPTAYVSQVAQFLVNNSGTNGAKPAQVSNGQPSPQTRQQNMGVYIKSFQPDPLIKAITRIGEKHGTNVRQIESLLRSLPSSASDLLSSALKLYDEWQSNLTDLLPVLDILRIAIPDANSVPFQPVLTILAGALDPSLLKHAMLSVRGVANLVARPDFDVNNKVLLALLGQALSMVQQVSDAQPEFSKPMAIALATLVLNIEAKGMPLTSVSLLVNAVALKIQKSQDAEAMYRLALAVKRGSIEHDKSWFTGSDSRVANLFS